MIMATDDGFVRTHDDASALLQYAVPGARVRTWRLRDTDKAYEAARGYEVTIARHGAPTLAVLGSYALPARAERLTKSLVDQVSKKANES